MSKKKILFFVCFLTFLPIYPIAFGFATPGAWWAYLLFNNPVRFSKELSTKAYVFGGRNISYVIGKISCCKRGKKLIK